MLNLNTTSTAFYVAGDLKKFVDGFFFAKGGRAPTMRVGGIDVQDLVRINRLLQKMVVVVDRGGPLDLVAVRVVQLDDDAAQRLPDPPPSRAPPRAADDPGGARQEAAPVVSGGGEAVQPVSCRGGSTRLRRFAACLSVSSRLQ